MCLHSLLSFVVNNFCPASYLCLCILFRNSLFSHLQASLPTMLTYFVGFACHWHFSKGGKQDSHVVCSSSNERWFVVKMHNGQLWPEKQRDVIFLSKSSHFQIHLNYNARFHKKMVTRVTITQYRQSSTYKQAVFQKVCKATVENSKQKLPIEAMLWMMVIKVQPTKQKLFDLKY